MNNNKTVILVIYRNKVLCYAFHVSHNYMHYSENQKTKHTKQTKQKQNKNKSHNKIIKIIHEHLPTMHWVYYRRLVDVNLETLYITR